jgi:hypothetical protein
MRRAVARAVLLTGTEDPVLGLRGLTFFSLAGAVVALAQYPGDYAREAVIPLTPGSVHGTIDIVSFGVAQLAAEDGKPFSTLHVREIFTNQDAVPWTVELAATTATIDDGQLLGVTAVNSNARGLPVLRVDRGQQWTVDLYFALGHTQPWMEPFDAVTVSYHINTPDHRYVAHAELARSSWSTVPLDRGYELGWGASWWANPRYLWPTYEASSGKLFARAPHLIVIARVPRAYYAEHHVIAASDEVWPRTDECDEW